MIEFKNILEDNDFLKEVVSLEAKELLQDLKNNYLHVILIPAPDPQFTEHRIRKSDGQNIKWYRDLYWSSGETWKRNHTIKFLKRMSEGIFNYDSLYVQKLLGLILNRLKVDINV